jgi:hypothetical protein
VGRRARESTRTGEQAQCASVPTPAPPDVRFSHLRTGALPRHWRLLDKAAESLVVRGPNLVRGKKARDRGSYEMGVGNVDGNRQRPRPSAPRAVSSGGRAWASHQRGGPPHRGRCPHPAARSGQRRPCGRTGKQAQQKPAGYNELAGAGDHIECARACAEGLSALGPLGPAGRLDRRAKESAAAARPALDDGVAAHRVGARGRRCCGR